MGALTNLRWEHERQRAAAANLMTTEQAARRMNVGVHMVKAWAACGLITNRGAGGRGNPALWDWEELRTAPQRRINHRSRGTCSRTDCDRPHAAKGLCEQHYRQQRRQDGFMSSSRPPTPERNAGQTLRRGGSLHPPRTLPYRALAVSCPECGRLRTTPDRLLRKAAGPLPPCPTCRTVRVVRNQRQRRKADDDFRRKQQRRTDRRRAAMQSQTVDNAHNHKKMWTGPELEIASRDDLSARQVAAMLGRTLHAVRGIRRALLTDPRKIWLASVTPTTRRTPARP